MALMWNRTVDWDAEDWRRGRVPQHRTRPLLSRRHDRAGGRPDRCGQGVCRAVRRRSRASNSRWPPTRSPASGAGPPKRSAASCARRGWPPDARSGRRPSHRTRRGRPAHPATSPVTPQRSARPRPGTGTVIATLAPPPRSRHTRHGDRPLQLAADEVADDREPEARRVLDVEAVGHPATVVADLNLQAPPWSPE